MTDREIKLFAAALYWRGSYSQCNPDVGFPASPNCLAGDITRQTGLKPTPKELKKILSLERRLEKGRGI